MGGIFGGGGQDINISSPVIASMRIQTSSQGRCVPLCYGKTRLAGNLVWQNDFTAIPHTSTQESGGKGGESPAMSQTTYTYRVAAIMGLCEGPVAAVPTVWADKAQTTPAALGMSVYTGSTSQTAFPYVTTNHPGEALGYRQLAYVATGAYDLGDNASLPNHTFEVEALLPFSSTILDANPKDVLVDFLTHASHGAGYPSARLAAMAEWSNYCVASGIFVSPAYTEQQSAAETVTALARIGNAAPVYSEGVLKVIPYGDQAVTGNGVTYTPNLTPVYSLTDDDFLDQGGEDPVIVQRGDPADAYNQVQVKFYNRANQYNEDVATAVDQASVELYGLRPMEPVTAHEICDAAVARQVAQIILQRAQGVRNTYRFKLGWKYALLEPMDLLTLTEGGDNGLNAVPVRITEIEENEDGELDITAEDAPAGVATGAVYPVQANGGYAANYNAAPGSVNVPVIFDAPGRMTAGGYEVWIAVAGTSGPWGGCAVWMSTDGTTYKQVGSIAGPARYGYLSAAFNAGGDPDTANTCAVDLTVSKGALTSGTADDADTLNTLCWCDGELFSYQTATLTAANKYTLGTRLRRGVYGTPIAAHASGKPFARIDAGLFRYAYDPALVGKTIWIKLQSVNVYGGGTEGLAGLPAYTYTIGGPIGAPADVTGATATAAADGVLLSWSASPTPNLAQYEIRRGTSWASAVYVGTSLTTQIKVPPVAVGTSTWLVKAIDGSGRYSVNAAQAVLAVSAPSAPAVTQQVVDNNVLLYWTASSSVLPVATYEIRRGAAWASAAVIGQKSGLFTSVFETAAGVYTYWVCAIDIAGNYGTPGSVTTTVNAPPDYVLKADVQSTFAGALSSALLELGAVVMPVNTSETWAAHFTAHGWASPQDQITAGFPLYAEPAAASGSYTEAIDYGTTLAACKISATWSGTAISGAPAIQCDILTSADNVNWTAYANVSQVYATNFRHVKVRITASGSGGLDLYRLDSLHVRLDVKLKNDAGAVTWNGNPATATFNVPFIDVTSIDLTPMGTTASLVAVTNFVSVANPTTFGVYLYNSTTGVAPTGPITVAWSAKGH